MLVKAHLSPLLFKVKWVKNYIEKLILKMFVDREP